MKQPVVVIGLGQLGGVFAHGFLRSGIAVVPVRRGDAIEDVAREVSDPRLVLVAVGEADLVPVLASLPSTYRDRVGLIQNELVESDWTEHGILTPTVTSVWFEKKREKPLHSIVESPVAGPRADLVGAALGSLDLPTRAIAWEDLAFELARKTVYILTANLAGLELGGTVGSLFSEHRVQIEGIVQDAITLAEHRAGTRFDRARLYDAVKRAVDADPTHVATGRSAPARLERAIAIADRGMLEVPAIRAVADRLAHRASSARF